MCEMSFPLNLPTLNYSDHFGKHSLALERDSTSIGRSPGQDLVLNEPYVSRRHAFINCRGSEYELVDLGSLHGTYLHGAIRLTQLTEVSVQEQF
jgi:pSer/pThr/pTyr-binding forkhead associated (FHA) protein